MYRPRAAFAWLLIALVCNAFIPSELRAAIVMEVSGIKGDSTIEGHKDWIVLSSYQQGMSVGISVNGGAGGAVEVSTPSYSEIALSKTLDKSSVPTALKLNSAKPVDKIVIEFLTSSSNPVAYYRITLTDAYFTSLSTSSGGDRPSETLSIFYSKITWEYYPTDSEGAVGPVVRGGWDALTKKAL